MIYNTQWELIQYDPNIYQCLHEDDPPEWYTKTIIPEAGLNVFGDFRLMPRTYNYATFHDCTGCMAYFVSGLLRRYVDYSTRREIFLSVKFTNGNVLTIKNVYDGGSWSFVTFLNGLETGSLPYDAVRRETNKMADPKDMLWISFVLDYTREAGVQTPYLSLYFYPPLQLGVETPENQCPILRLYLSSTAEQSQQLITFLTGSQIDDPDTGNESTTGGGGGSFIYDDHEIDFPDVPLMSAVSSGLIGLYKLSPSNLADLSDFLWGPNFFSQIIKNFASPFENIISFHILPLNVSASLDTIVIGNIDTAVSAEKLSGQFIDANFGSVHIPKIFGNQLDFDPATECQIFLPYIGFRQIDLDAVSGGDITLRYRIDLLTGDCVAMLRVTQSDRYNHDSVEYFYNGNCAVHIPLSGSSYLNMMGSVIGGVAAAAGSAKRGNLMGVSGGVSSIFNSKPTYDRAGNVTGTPGYLGCQDAFVLLNSPVSSIAGDIKHLEGIRSNVKTSFSGLSGYQKIQSYIPDATLSSECTDEELREIETLLQEGVIF